MGLSTMVRVSCGKKVRIIIYKIFEYDTYRGSLNHGKSVMWKKSKNNNLLNIEYGTYREFVPIIFAKDCSQVSSKKTY